MLVYCPSSGIERRSIECRESVEGQLKCGVCFPAAPLKSRPFDPAKSSRWFAILPNVVDAPTSAVEVYAHSRQKRCVFCALSTSRCYRRDICEGSSAPQPDINRIAEQAISV